MPPRWFIFLFVFSFIQQINIVCLLCAMHYFRTKSLPSWSLLTRCEELDNKYINKSIGVMPNGKKYYGKKIKQARSIGSSGKCCLT